MFRAEFVSNRLKIMKTTATCAGKPLRKKTLGKKESIDSTTSLPKFASGNSSESNVRSKQGTQLNITIEIKEREKKNEDGNPVFYKHDEGRFRNENTLKLKTLSEYNVNIDVEPPQDIIYVKMGGRRHETFYNDGTTGCSFVWSTQGMKETERKYRTILPCAIKFKEFKELQFELLSKFYSQEEIVHYHGIRLSSLEIESVVTYNKKTKAGLHNVTFNSPKK